MDEIDKPVPGRWDWLQERVQPLDADVEAVLKEPVETSADIPENGDRLRRLVGPLDDDIVQVAIEQPLMPVDGAVEEDEPTI
ncbi:MULTISPECIES: hypothetical protein [Methylobacterium]|uniref:hypothetical protein n=1 Tax=Methylobacterium TaxID=407 RepID=UPI0013ECF41D|nr:hypothetical protein [Methylobacterium sp. DB0501]NGM33915.1 hypothetical protein [Methylobacterium sp. DB0501]